MKKLILILTLFISVKSFAQTGLADGVSTSIANINDAIQGAVAASGTDTYTGTKSGLTYTSGKAFSVTFPNANTGAATFNLNSLGAKTIKKFSAGSLVDLSAGDISAGETKRLRYNGTYLIIEGGSGGTTINGTGFVKASGTTISYDNSTYLTGNQSITLSGDVSGSGTTAITTTVTKINGTTPGTGVINFIGTPSSSNLATAITDEVGSGSAQFSNIVTNTQTGSYTLVISDLGKIIEMNSASATTLTFPPNASVAFSAGAPVYLKNLGAGVCTLTPGSGVTLTPATGSTLSINQGCWATAIRNSSAVNTWDIISTSSSTMIAGNGISITNGSGTVTIGTSGNATFSHIIGSSSAPTIASGVGAGTGATVSITKGTDISGIINITTGTSPTLSATVATITFNSTYSVAPKVVLTPANVNASALSGAGSVYVDDANTTTSVFVLTSGSTALAGSTSYKWQYTITQ